MMIIVAMVIMTVPVVMVAVVMIAVMVVVMANLFDAHIMPRLRPVGRMHGAAS